MKKAYLVKYQSTGKRAIKMVFTPDPLTVSQVKTIPSRAFHKELRYWSAPLTTEAVYILYDIGFEFCPKLQDHYISLTQPEPKKIDIIQVPGLTGTLRPFQAEGVTMLEEWDGRALLADDMGLGKTIQGIGYMQLHRDKVPVVIVCPSSVKTNWEFEMLKWMTPKPNIQILSGKKPNQPITGDYVILNYDILAYWVKKLVAIKPAIVISDECHYWSNNSANRTKAMKQLVKHSTHIIAMSGTPFENAPIEIYNVINAIDPHLFPSRWIFAQEYCDAKHTGFGWDFNGSSNTDKLHKILTETIMIRRLKKDVLKELPPKMYVSLPIQINNRKEYDHAEEDFIDWFRGSLQKKYDTLEKEMQAELQAIAKKKGLKDFKADTILDKEEVAESIEIRVEKMSQAAAMARIEVLKQIAMKGKLDECISWIGDFLQSGEKLAVFCTHTFVIDELVKAFPDISVVIDGRVPAKARQGIVHNFQTNKKVKLFFGNIKACGEGITLTAASNAMVLELPWTPGKYNQVVDRVHRITQTKQVTIYIPFAVETIESRLSDILKIKQEMFDGVIDGKQTKNKQTNVFDEVLNSYRY